MYNLNNENILDWIQEGNGLLFESKKETKDYFKKYYDIFWNRFDKKDDGLFKENFEKYDKFEKDLIKLTPNYSKKYADFLDSFIFSQFDNIIDFLNKQGYFINPDGDNEMNIDNFLECELSEDFDLTDNQKNILEMRYYITYPEGIKDKSWKDIVKRISRSLQSQLIKYLDDSTSDNNLIEKIKYFEYIIFQMMYSRLFIFNTPQIFNLGYGIKKEIFDKDINDVTMNDYRLIYKSQIKEKNQTTQACFILDMEDSISGIFDTLKDQSLIQKSSGGIGFNIGRLRPNKGKIKSTNSESSGQLSFLEIYNSTGKVVKQGNKRRWAGMCVLSDTVLNDNEVTLHPDTESFIKQKENNDGESILSTFNISVGINNSKDLYQKIKNNGKIKLTFEGKKYSDIVLPENKNKVEDYIDQNKFINMIVDNVYNTGDPGVLLMDVINQYNPLKEFLPIWSTNPCGERQGISSYKYGIYDTCDLGHLDVSKFVELRDNNNIKYFDKEFTSQAILGYYFLDLLHDLMMYPIDKVKKGVIGLRSVGLGFYGLQGQLMKQKIPYNSEKGRLFAYKYMNMLEVTSQYLSYIYQQITNPFIFQMKSNPKIGQQEIWNNNEYYIGHTDYDYQSIYSLPFYTIDYDSIIEKMKTYVFNFKEIEDELGFVIRRNINTTTIQPTGTTSIIGQTNKDGDVGSGSEPFFSLSYKRQVIQLDNSKKEQIYKNKLFERYLNENYYLKVFPDLPIDDIIDYIVKNNGHVEGLFEKFKTIDGINEDELKNIENVLQTSHDIDYMDHIKMLEQIQWGNSSQTSKTINMKNKQTKEDVKKQYMYQFKSGIIKGLTIYRDGSLNFQVLSSKDKKKKDKDSLFNINEQELSFNIDKKSGRIIPKERPVIMRTLKKTINLGNGTPIKIHMEVGFTQNKEPFEVFIRPTETSKQYQNIFNQIGRLISLQFRSGIDYHEQLKQLKKVKNYNREYDSMSSVLSDSIQEIINVGTMGSRKQKDEINRINIEQKDWVLHSKGYYIDNEGKKRCPICGEIIQVENGCVNCKNPDCGWSQCS